MAYGNILIEYDFYSRTIYSIIDVKKTWCAEHMCLNHAWLVVLIILKSISQWKGLSHILWKIKNV